MNDITLAQVVAGRNPSEAGDPGSFAAYSSRLGVVVDKG
jgi:hypothetical protein